MNQTTLETLRQSLLAQVQVFDDWGVFRRLLFDEPLAHSPEGILRTLGWVHIYSASGIHLYALASALETITELVVSKCSHRLDRNNPHRSSRLPLRTIKVVLRTVTLILFWFLWALQKFRFGFIRPLFMFGLRKWGQALGLKWARFAPLLITFLLDIILSTLSASPHSTLDWDGKIHYFLAVGGGILAMDFAVDSAKSHFEKNGPKSGGIVRFFLEHGSLAWGSWLGIAAIELWRNHQVALFTPLWSLLMLPLFCGLLYPALVFSLLFACVGLPVLLSASVRVGSACTTFFIQVMDQLNLTFFVIPQGGIMIAFFLGLIFVGILRILESTRRRIAFVALFVVFLGMGRVVLEIYGEELPLWHRVITQVDVGQGDALMIHDSNYTRGGRAEMIDVGGYRKIKPEFWLSEFSKLGVTQVDGILLSHLDEDHQGALQFIPSLIEVRCVETHPALWRSEKGQRLTAAVRNQQSHTIIADQNCVQLVDHVWLGSGTHGKGNELMAGSFVEISPHQVYLAAGDADQSQELAYYDHFKGKIAQYPDRIWKVSHHGSRYSSGEEFLALIQPKKAWVSVGKHNPYHHPHPDTLAKFFNLKIPLQRTDEEGDIELSGEVKSNAYQPFRFKTAL